MLALAFAYLPRSALSYKIKDKCRYFCKVGSALYISLSMTARHTAPRSALRQRPINAVS